MKKAILVVDDLEINRAVIKAIFASEYQVIEASNGTECLQIAREREEDIGVVLLDLNMPDISGLEILKMKQEGKILDNIPIIVLTVNDNQNAQIEALNLGAVDYINVPVVREVARIRIRNAFEMAEKIEELEKANAAKQDFLSTMSHEIRTPMNAIIGMTRLAQDEVEPQSVVAHYLKEIDSSSNYLLGILNDILDMSRLQSGKFQLKPEWVRPGDVLLPCIEMIRPQMESKGIHFHYPAKIKLPKTMEYYVDVLRTQQILMNLLNNAFKYTKEGGTVSLEMRNLEFSDTYCADELVVSDNGCGMSEEFLARVGNPFEQERNDYTGYVQGTGMGLAIVKEIARAMGGDIRIESEIGKGSKFYVKFPYKYRVAKASGVSNEPQKFDEVMLENKQILVVEDNELNALIATRLLESKKMIVTGAVNGEEAVKIFEENAMKFDAILMDIRMPVLDGIEATRIIRTSKCANAKVIPIIAMTANAFEEDKQNTKEAGMDAHLSKPIVPELLFQTLCQKIDYYTKRKATL